jgi:hypothetical protein
MWVLDRLDAEKARRGEATDAELLRGKLDIARQLLDEVRRRTPARRHRRLTRRACSD